jgi:hypothetical protein
VLLLDSSIDGLKAQARQLLSKVVDNFLTHAALLEGLKNSGAAAAAMRGSDGGSSEDIVMVEASAVTTGDSGSSSPRGHGTAAVPRTSSASGLMSAAGFEGMASLAASLGPCAIGLSLLHAAHVTGESASLRPLLVQLLPGVLQLQELSGPGLQQLVGEAKAGFVQVRHLWEWGGCVRVAGGLFLGAC